MRNKRRNHSSKFKAKVALAAFKGDKTMQSCLGSFEVHPDQITSCRKQLLENVQGAFGSGTKVGQEAHVKELHAKTGQLTLENNFLSKALGR